MPCTLIIRVLATFIGHIPFLYTFIVMREYCRDVDSVWAGHTVIAFVAWDGFQIVDVVCNLHQEGVLLFIDWTQGRKGTEILPEILHVGHPTKHRQHTFRCSCKPKGPTCHALSGSRCFILATILSGTLARRPPSKGSMIVIGMFRLWSSPYR